MLKLFCYITLLVIQVTSSMILYKIINDDNNYSKPIFNYIVYFFKFLSDTMCVIYTILLVIYCCSVNF